MEELQQLRSEVMKHYTQFQQWFPDLPVTATNQIQRAYKEKLVDIDMEMARLSVTPVVEA